MRSALVVGGRGEHHRQHSEFVVRRDLAAAPFHACGLFSGRDVTTQSRNDDAVLVVEVVVDRSGQLVQRLGSFGYGGRPVEHHRQHSIEGAVLGFELSEDLDQFGARRASSGQWKESSSS